MISRGLLKIGSSYLLRNRWFSILMVIGIALGVSVVVAIDIANDSALRSFDLSKEAVVGRATHQIIGGPGGFDESIYTKIRRGSIGSIATPVISANVSSPQMGDLPFELLGIDPFTENDFRSYLGREQIPVEQLTDFFTLPGAIILSQDTLERFGLSIGAEIDLDIGGKLRKAVIAGVIAPADSISQRALEGIILADIATVQEFESRPGLIDRVDLILEEVNQAEKIQKLQEFLPIGYQIVSIESRNSSINEMTAAFRLNLTALSLLALLVGLFLIYNTMTYSIVRRRQLFGLLRCIGVTRREIVFLVLGEAFFVGLLGSVIGIILGLILGQRTIAMVTQTVNDLYYTTTVQSPGLDVSSLIKGVLVGVFATIITAIFPAIEASSVPPRIALSRSSLESKTQNVVRILTIAGFLFIAAGLLIFRIQTPNIYVGFGGTLLVVLGLAMESAFVLILVAKILKPLLSFTFGFLGRMAPSNLVNNLSRTSVAVAALMVSVAVAIGMNLMIESFRSTVKIWLEETLLGDIYISAPSFISSNPTEAIDPGVLVSLGGWQQIERIDTLRTVRVESVEGPITLNATENPDFGRERKYLQASVSEDEVWDELQNGNILISEALSFRFELQLGDSISLLSEKGWVDFTIIGIIYEYTSSEGSIWMAYGIYRNFWNDEGMTALALRLREGTDIDLMATELQNELTGIQRLNIRPNRVLKEEVLEIFDRTFAITNAMRLMATLVAFIGVLTTALVLQLEKQRELGILRALGLTGRQLWHLVLMESGLIGLVSGVLAMPTGYILARILIDVINRRSFGWTLQIDINGGFFWQGLLLSFTAALLAGVFPAIRLNKMATAEAIRYE